MRRTSCGTRSASAEGGSSSAVNLRNDCPRARAREGREPGATGLSAARPSGAGRQRAGRGWQAGDGCGYVRARGRARVSTPVEPARYARWMATGGETGSTLAQPVQPQGIHNRHTPRAAHSAHIRHRRRRRRWSLWRVWCMHAAAERELRAQLVSRKGTDDCEPHRTRRDRRVGAFRVDAGTRSALCDCHHARLPLQDMSLEI